MKNTLLIALFACFAVSGQAAVVTLGSPGNLTPGTAFDVPVLFSGLDPQDLLLGYGFGVNVANPSLVAFTGETAGPFSTDISGNSGIAPLVAGIFFPGLAAGDFTDPVTLAVLHFNALAAGATTISLFTDLSDPNTGFDQGLTFLIADPQNISASLSVTTGVSGTPEPSTMAMVLMAFAVSGAGVSLRRRRRSGDSAGSAN